MVYNVRVANGHRRRQLRQRILAEETLCALCGRPVDKTLPPFLDGSPEIDEILPVAQGGDPLDRSNCRLVHRRCNRYRDVTGARVDRKAAGPRLQPLETTRRWW